MKFVERKTRETDIRVEMKEGTGAASVSTGSRFLDHMMTTLARYSGLDITISAKGDLKHHLIEDLAIAVGSALAGLIPETCARYADRTIAMDDALVQAVLDVGGRPFYQGPLPSNLYEQWMRSFADNAKITIHIRVLRGKDRHHIVEAAFKALGLAIHDALVETDTIFSTKGAVSMESD
ncbi:MAG TPA: imidazoleglycerol-phosphate dehydratase [Gemmatimonadaceae bacterium]